MKIAVIGYGKMGRAVEETAVGRGHEIVSVIDIGNREDFGCAAFRSADVAIEFTSPEAAYENCLAAFRQGVKVVSGSTGWIAGRVEEMKRLCEEEGCTLFWSSNFSVGMAVFNALNSCLARMMDSRPEYNVKIEETHHTHKLDAPSGTAVTLAEGVVAALGRKTGWTRGVFTAPDGTASGTDSVAPQLVAVNSVRRGGMPGIHSVIYDSEADSITITHEAHSRRGFALGAVLAAEYTASHKGFLTMRDLFPF